MRRVQLTTFVHVVRDLARKIYKGAGFGETIAERAYNFPGFALLKAVVVVSLQLVQLPQRVLCGDE